MLRVLAAGRFAARVVVGVVAATAGVVLVLLGG